MPVDVESDRWAQSTRVDTLEVELERFLRARSEMAYTPAEITESLVETTPEVFPDALLAEDATTASRIALVACRLEKLAWHERLKVHSLDGTLYYTDCEGGQFPVADLERKIPERFIGVEQRIEELDAEVDRLRHALQAPDEEHPDNADLQ
ncbi:hypothetical protein [Natronococcus roseus]|uniref:hypothetical protein n=1 Tax=Natronococcus roseus TaxID=1052014 RepID=UPI00374CC388